MALLFFSLFALRTVSVAPCGDCSDAAVLLQSHVSKESSQEPIVDDPRFEAEAAQNRSLDLRNSTDVRDSILRQAPGVGKRHNQWESMAAVGDTQERRPEPFAKRWAALEESFANLHLKEDADVLRELMAYMTDVSSNTSMIYKIFPKAILDAPDIRGKKLDAPDIRGKMLAEVLQTRGGAARDQLKQLLAKSFGVAESTSVLNKFRFRGNRVRRFSV